MRFWVLLWGLAAALGCGERSMPVEPAGKATTDCSMAEILAGTCSDTADPTLDEVPDGYVAPVDSTVATVADSTVTEEEEEVVVAAGDSTAVAPDTIDRTQIADPFNIQIEYRHVGGPVFTAEDIAAIERAARRWEEVIVEGFPDETASLELFQQLSISESLIANVQCRRTFLGHFCKGDAPDNITFGASCKGSGCKDGAWFRCDTRSCEASEGTVWTVYQDETRQVYVEDFVVVVHARAMDAAWDGELGSALSADEDYLGERGKESEIPLGGIIYLHWRTADFTEQGYENGADGMYRLALHEIGHALGLVRRNERLGLPDYWQRPAFVSRFGVTDGVFGFLNGGHFNLPGDVMYVSSWMSDVTSLSAAVLDDMGYTVDYDAVEEWRRPAGKRSVLAEHNLHLRCGVGH